MVKILLNIYDYFHTHIAIRYATLATLTIILIVLVSRLGYKEDISDFIPFQGKNATALKMYQNMSGASRIFVTFKKTGSSDSAPDSLVAAVDTFVENLNTRKAEVGKLNVVSEVDVDLLDSMLNYIYANIPYLLTEADYNRIDSLLDEREYVSHQLEEDKQMLMFPSGGILSQNLSRDPLNLFTPVAERLQATGAGVRYENYSGHIFTPDMLTGIVMIDTPYGASESEANSRLVTFLAEVSQQTKNSFEDVEINILGSPVIAVGNARQIKTDSIMSVSIAMVLILVLLLYVFRSVRNITLIAVSIGWGWLFALASLSILHDKVSIIVIGISSVILGIAVNYPLHVIAHIAHDDTKRSAFREIITPLLVGNITTVGAFLALVPLQSIALRDLGLFASFLLLGTILFALLFLPHMTKSQVKPHHTFVDRLGSLELETKPWLVIMIAVLTVVFGYFSLDTKFDSNMAHINYMTKQDKEQMAYFQQMLQNDTSHVQLYVLTSDSTLSSALQKSEVLIGDMRVQQAKGNIESFRACTNMIVSEKEQQHRLKRWSVFAQKYRDSIHEELVVQAKIHGFSEDSFTDFYDIVDQEYVLKKSESFLPMANTVYGGYIFHDDLTGQYHVASVLTVGKDKTQQVENTLSHDDEFWFNMQSINSAIASNLSDNFNYIGWACGLIVFLFLWISMGRIELAIISFTPMAVSWVWILGIMSLLDVQFNIVNIILATFIFGQGDDYTIFMTEGASYEYAHGKKILGSYKHSIIVSAIIMFVGIGTLIIAKHPALHSLAEVTIIGMFAVVLMAYTLPPLLFKWLVATRDGLRHRPLTLRRLIVSSFAAVVFFCQLACAYIYGCILHIIYRDEHRRRALLQSFVHVMFKFDMSHIPGVKFDTSAADIDFERQSLIICNHQSMLDSALFMALSPKVVLISNTKVSSNYVISKMYKWLGHISLSSDINNDIGRVRDAVRQGYSLVMFPEGKRNPESSILRFHKGAFMVAETLGLDITPIMIHGINNVLPRNSIVLYEGKMSVLSLGRILQSDKRFGTGYSERTRSVHKLYIEEYARIKQNTETYDYLKGFVLDKYMYKGRDIYSSVRKNINRGISDNMLSQVGDDIVFSDNGYGELALIYALMHPDISVVAIMADAERAEILKCSSAGMVSNLDIRTQ